MGVYQSSDVRFTELDLSQVVQNASTSIGALIIASSKGQVGTRQFFSDYSNFEKEFGKANPQVGYGHYAARAYLAQGNQLWVTRAIGTGYIYGGVAIGSASTLGVLNTAVNTYASANPASFDFTSSSLFASPTSNYLYVSARGPGAYAANVGVSTTSANMQTPAGLTYKPIFPFLSVISSLVPTTILQATATIGVTGVISKSANVTINPATLAPTGITATLDTTVVAAAGNKVVLYNMTNPLSNGAWTVTGAGDWTKLGTPTTTYFITGNTSTVYYQSNSLTNTWSVFTFVTDSADPQVLAANSVVMLTGQTTASQLGLYQIQVSGLLVKVPLDTSGTATDNTTVVSAGHVFKFDWNGYNYVRDWNYLATLTTNKTANSYLVTALNSSGETISSNTVSIPMQAAPDIVGGYSLMPDVISWTPVVAAVSYNVYQKIGVTGTLADYHFVANSDVATFTNYGLLALSTAASPPLKYEGTTTFNLNVFDLLQNSQIPVEVWSVTLLPGVDGFGNQTEVSNLVNDTSLGSRYINVLNVFGNSPATTPIPTVYSSAMKVLSGGSSGTAVTATDVVNAWDLYKDKEQVSISLLINGGYSTPTVQLAMDAIARKRMDCMAILDLPSSYQTPAAALNYRNNILNLNTNYSAIYGPDLLIGDVDNAIQLYVPPSGHVAGAYAYNDNVADAWFAPAGLNRGLLSILGLRKLYNEGDRELLSGANINYVRKLPGLGFAIMEAWTLQSKRSALSFVPVRRLLIVIETALAKALLFSLWEPNDPVLRLQIITMIGDYLDTIKRRRGVNKFLIVCDNSNNLSTDVANGILRVDVYVEPTLPVQQIAARAIITKQNASFSEAVKLANA
jgi:hypothetical protein